MTTPAASHDLRPCDRALLTAASRGDIDAMRKALREGADVNAANDCGLTALHYVIDGEKTIYIGWLLEQGARPDVQSLTEGTTPLISACSKGYCEAAQCLIGGGAGLEVRDHRGQTPLLAALREGEMACALLLVALGADAAAMDRAGISARDMLQQSGSHDDVEAFERAVARRDMQRRENLRRDTVEEALTLGGRASGRAATFTYKR